MINKNSILTNESNDYEIRQFYYAPQVLFPPENKLIHSLYSFISYRKSWEEAIFSKNAVPTKIIYNASIQKDSNLLLLFDAPTMNDFAVGQEISHDLFVPGTKITYVDEDNFLVHLDSVSPDNIIGEFLFIGFLEHDNKITVDATEDELPVTIDYTKCLMQVDITSELGLLHYNRAITNYNAITKTFTVDSAFDDYPDISENAVVTILYTDKYPPAPKNTQKYKKDIFKNLIFIKQVKPNFISPVIKRINWTSGNVYDYYRDDVDLSLKDENEYPLYQYYVMNQFYQVFKCLWNNNGGQSIVEPYFVAGNFDDTTNIFYDPDDGYKWKYMYTIPYSSLQYFMNEDWIPVPINDIPDISTSAETWGGIECINVTNSGENYDTANALVTVEITGDGYDAVGVAEVDKATKTIQNISVSNPGYAYTYANVSIVSTQGNNATAIASVSAIGGNGSDSISELSCEHIMVACKFDGDENGKLPQTYEMRQYGLIVNPLVDSVYPFLANGESYSTTTDVIVSSGFENFQNEEIVYQTENNANFANAVFTATCVNFDPVTNKMKLVNGFGNHINLSPLYGKTSGAVRTLLQKNDSDYIGFSGNIIYIENCETVLRSYDSMDLFRIVLKF